MILEDFKHFEGQHCETTATGTLLDQIGIKLSEPMLFGLGEGLGFIYWKMKTMDFPFIGGRIKTDLLTENLCRNLGLELEVTETSSKSRAWKNVTRHIDKGTAVGLKLDCYHLDYFTNKFHFAGHYVAMYGYDDNFAYLVDTAQQGGKVRTSLNSLELARSEKGPMSSRNRTYTIKKKGETADLKNATRRAIKNNATDFLTPPIKNIGYKGILKAGSEIKKWFSALANVERDFQTTAMLMERAGTGGALFRNLYRDFLAEAADCLQSKEVDTAHRSYAEIAKEWKNVSELLYLAGEEKKAEYINKASKILSGLSFKEHSVMKRLEAEFA